MLWVFIRIALPRQGDSNEESPCSGKVILMSTHNIGFYEELTKNIFELSSNIIKYAPYFFCCKVSQKELNYIACNKIISNIAIVFLFLTDNVFHAVK